MEKKKKKGITGISRGPIREGNTMTWYVQDKDGNPVDAERVSNIRQRARAIWRQLLRMGIAPNSWAQAGLDAYDLYEHHMVERFPELSYCEDNWKAHMIASDNYPSWYADHIKETSIKLESSPAPENLKRRALSPPADSKRAAKKSQQLHPSGLPLSTPVNTLHNAVTPPTYTPTVVRPSPLSKSLLFDEPSPLTLRSAPLHIDINDDSSELKIIDPISTAVTSVEGAVLRDIDTNTIPSTPGPATTSRNPDADKATPFSEISSSMPTDRPLLVPLPPQNQDVPFKVYHLQRN